MTLTDALRCRLQLAWLRAVLMAARLDPLITGREWPIERRLMLTTHRTWLLAALRRWLRGRA